MLALSWDVVRERLNDREVMAQRWIGLAAADIKKYPHTHGNPEALAQLLANLNYYVLELGELQAETEQMKTWTEKRYEIEKGLEVVRLVRDEKKPVGFSDAAKYEKVQQFLDTMVSAGALHLRVQNARSSARDTTEAIRSRISQIKGALRSS